MRYNSQSAGLRHRSKQTILTVIHNNSVSCKYSLELQHRSNCNVKQFSSIATAAAMLSSVIKK